MDVSPRNYVHKQVIYCLDKTTLIPNVYAQNSVLEPLMNYRYEHNYIQTSDWEDKTGNICNQAAEQRQCEEYIHI